MFKNLKSFFLRSPRRTFEGVLNISRKDVDEGLSSYAQNYDINMHTVPAAVACINLLVSALTSLDWRVYARGEDGALVEAKHRLNLILSNPSAHHDSFSFYEMLVEDFFVSGNAFARIHRDRSGQVMRLSSAPCASIKIDNLTTRPRSYTATLANGTPLRLSERNLLHLHGPFFDPDTGLSLSQVQTSAIYPINISHEAAVSLRSNVKFGLKAPGWVSSELDFTNDQHAKFMTDFTKEFTGNMNSGKVPILPQALEYKPINLTPIDQYIISVLKWSVADIARCFGVPLALIHSVDSKVNSELERHWASFIRTTVVRHIKRFSAQMSFKLLTLEERLVDGLVINADTLGLHASTLADAAGLVKTLSQSGVLELDELRKLLPMLNLAAKPDGLDNPPQTAGAPPREMMDKVEDQ